MIHTIEVENIKCGGCMNSIKTALMKIDGVSNVEIDKDKELITLDAAVERELLTSTLSGLGYPEKGNNNMLHKAKSYVSCAIGNISNK